MTGRKVAGAARARTKRATARRRSPSRTFHREVAFRGAQTHTDWMRKVSVVKIRRDVVGGKTDSTKTRAKSVARTSGKPYFTEALTVLTGARWAHARLEHTYLDNQCVILQENNFVACTKT